MQNREDNEIIIPEMNFAFLELSVELSALKNYWDMVERQLPTLVDEATDQLFQKWLGPNPNEQDVDMASSAVTSFTEFELPRMFRSTVLVILWAVFESAARQVAEALRQKKGLVLKAKDIKGNHELDSLNKYFQHVLEFPLVRGGDELSRLDALRILRNAISHSNSRIDEEFQNKKKEDWKKIQDWSTAGTGLSVDMGYLDFSKDYIEGVLTTVGESVENLIARAQEALK
jgi:hypothetical protein